MVKSLSDFRKQIKPEVQYEAKAKAVEIVAQMSLSELRKDRGLNQSAVAKQMEIAQPNVSKIESRPDALLSTLTGYIEALGGKLELHAKFPDGQDVQISSFDSN